MRTVNSGRVCTYTANGNGGRIAIEEMAPAFCALLDDVMLDLARAAGERVAG